MITFVILHYKNLEETFQCVEGIKKSFKDYTIIIVENGSGNNSDVSLNNEYGNDVKIEVIINVKNQGFSAGNNIGYEYAKVNYDSDYIIVLNSDVYIDDILFESKIRRIYNENNFHILGPDILTPDERHQNPLRIKELELVDIRKKIWRKKVILTYLQFINRFKCFESLQKLEQKFYGTGHNQYEWAEGNRDVVLHGACYILSRNFIVQSEKLFYPETFLYMEEDILFSNAKRKGMTMLYNPEIQVLHKCGSSTDTSGGGLRSKRINWLRRMIASSEIYFKYKCEEN